MRMFMFMVATVSLVFFAGCADSRPAIHPYNRDTRIHSIAHQLPHGWRVKSWQRYGVWEDSTQPWNAKSGFGDCILLDNTLVDGKWEIDAVVFLMPLDYQTNPDYSGDLTPPRYLQTLGDVRVYLWTGAGAQEWKNIERDVICALTY